MPVRVAARIFSRSSSRASPSHRVAGQTVLKGSTFLSSGFACHAGIRSGSTSPVSTIGCRPQRAVLVEVAMRTAGAQTWGCLAVGVPADSIACLAGRRYEARDRSGMACTPKASRRLCKIRATLNKGVGSWRSSCLMAIAGDPSGARFENHQILRLLT